VTGKSIPFRTWEVCWHAGLPPRFVFRCFHPIQQIFITSVHI